MAEITLKNNCPGRIWYRFYDEQGKFSGFDLPAQSSSTHSTSFSPVFIKGQAWELEDPEIWKPTFKGIFNSETTTHLPIITPVFGPRTADSIKVFMACLAGPADPNVRNDITLIQEFIKAGVPHENVWMFLERQCTPEVIKESLKVAADTCSSDDILFVYLGGHGSGSAEGDYTLATYNGGTSGKLVMEALNGCSAQVFLVTDSCHSGAMIEDAKHHFASNGAPANKWSFLASTKAEHSACTGWKLIQMLIDQIFKEGEYSTPEQVAKYVADTLRTSYEEQRAQFHLL